VLRPLRTLSSMSLRPVRAYARCLEACRPVSTSNARQKSASVLRRRSIGQSGPGTQRRSVVCVIQRAIASSSNSDLVMPSTTTWGNFARSIRRPVPAGPKRPSKVELMQLGDELFEAQRSTVGSFLHSMVEAQGRSMFGASGGREVGDGAHDRQAYSPSRSPWYHREQALSAVSSPSKAIRKEIWPLPSLSVAYLASCIGTIFRPVVPTL
jgi:hypothetical protein